MHPTISRKTPRRN